VKVLESVDDKTFFLTNGVIKRHLPFTGPQWFFHPYPETIEVSCVKDNDWSHIPEVQANT